MNIIPGVLATSSKELKEQLSKVAWAKKIQVDIMDGKFVPNKTIQARELAKKFPNQEVQIHLMAEKPEKYVNTYSKMGAKEFILHSETLKDTLLLERIRLKGMKSGIALNPETKVKDYEDALVHSDIALVMTVHPGYSGQKLLKGPLKKIKQIRKINPLIKVGTDGGCNMETCKLIKEAGADFAIATSAITKNKNPEKAHTRLKRC